MTYAADIVPDRDEALYLIKTHGYIKRDEPFKLASGQLSHDYIDGKLAIDTGSRLKVVSRAMIELARQQNMDFPDFGGLTMGSYPLAHGIAIVADVGWFSVRKEPKPRGREQWIEGS